jgi:hypothetical protein
MRIEFGGAKLANGGGNLNSLLIAGAETVIENVMVSFSGGNSVEVYGGDLNMSQMVSFKSSNDDYRFNFEHNVELLIQQFVLLYPVN